MTAEQRQTLMSMRQAGVAVNQVALQMNISQRTVPGSGGGSWRLSVVLRSPASGLPKKTTLREVQQHRFQSLETVNRMWIVE